MKIKERKDLLTGEPFIPMRINQRFLSSENRIKYYNDKANEQRQSVAYVNKPLHINFRVLNELMQGKKTLTLHKQYLLGKGFNFNVHTHYEKHEEKSQIAIYQYILIRIDNEQIKIIKND